jgi:hypothetical protein
MTINKDNIHQKFDNDWQNNIKSLSLILDGTETDETKKKSKQLETLFSERKTLTDEKEKNDAEVRKLKDKLNTLKNTTAYHREAQHQLTRISLNINSNGDSLDTKWANFFGTGATKWRTEGWTTKIKNFYKGATAIDNLYKVKINDAEVEITEDQIVNTLARVVKALEKVDLADFVEKYNAKEGDGTKQANVAKWLQEIKDWGAEVKGKGDHYDIPHVSLWQNYTKPTVPNTLGTWANSNLTNFNFAHFFDLVELVADQPFLANLDASKHNEVPQSENWKIALKGNMWQMESATGQLGLKDLGYEIDNYGSQVKLYKSSSTKRAVNVSGGVAGWLKLAKNMWSVDNKAKLHNNFMVASSNPNQLLLQDCQSITPTTDYSSNQNFVFGTNFALPESVEDLETIVAELEAEKIGNAVITVNTKEKIAEIEGKNQTVISNLTPKDTAVQTLISEILTKKREKLAAYKLDKGFNKVDGGEDNRREVTDLYLIQELLLELRYLENDGNPTQPSSVAVENTAYEAIEGLITKLTKFYLIDQFRILAEKSDGSFDAQQAITRIKTGKYTNKDNREVDLTLFGKLPAYEETFAEKEKIVKLPAWEITWKNAIEKELGREDNRNETLTDWQTKLKAIDATLNETIITEAWKAKWGDVGNHQTLAEVEKLIKKVIGTDKKVKPDFLTEIQKTEATLTDLKALLGKEPKDIITHIELYVFNNLPDTGEDKDRAKTQWIRKVKKALGKTGAEIDQDLTPEEIKEAVYKIAVGELELSTQALKADLTEYETQTTQQTEPSHWEKHKWKYLGGIGGSLGCLGILAVAFWDKIKNWGTGGEEKEVTLKEEVDL